MRGGQLPRARVSNAAPSGWSRRLTERSYQRYSSQHATESFASIKRKGRIVLLVHGKRDGALVAMAEQAQTVAKEPAAQAAPPRCGRQPEIDPVSYTHLTLPTN